MPMSVTTERSHLFLHLENGGRCPWSSECHLHPSLCQQCCRRYSPPMLTTYCILGRCAACETYAELAMVKA